MKTSNPKPSKVRLLCGCHVKANDDNCPDLKRHVWTEHEYAEILKKKSEPNHTPTPWRVDIQGNLRQETGKEIVVSVMPHTNRNKTDDAAFIVRAVNSHEELLKALKFVVTNYELSEALKKIGALEAFVQAIAKAEASK